MAHLKDYNFDEETYQMIMLLIKTFGAQKCYISDIPVSKRNPLTNEDKSFKIIARFKDEGERYAIGIKKS